MKAALLGLVLAVSVALGCSGSAATNAAAQSAQDQQIAANVVTALNDAWKLAAQLCEAPGVTVKCGPTLAVAYNYVISAGLAVDTWGAVGQNNYACAVNGAASLLPQIMALLGITAAPPAFTTALTLAKLAVGPCVVVVDGGAG